MVRKSVWSLMVVGFVTVFLLAPGAARGELPLWDQWTRELDALGKQLRAGSWETAGKAARELAQKIADHSGGTMGYLRAKGEELDGAQVGQGRMAEAIALGRAAAYVAIAEAAQGQREKARWYWYMAQNLDSRWRTTDLSAYGEAGAFLVRERIKPAGEQVAEVDVIDPVVPEGVHKERFREPVRTKVLYPKRTPDLASRDRFSQALFIQITVEKDGTVTQPVVVDAPLYPGLIYEAFEAMSVWRYRPATLDGQPIPFRYVVPMIFADDRPLQTAIF